MVVLKSSLSRAASVLALLAIGACGLLKREATVPGPTDANIAAIFLAANNTDISYAQVALAPGRTTTPAILGFANRMAADHASLNRAAIDLYSTIGIVPQDNTTSLDFRDESAAKRDTLRERNGALFDSTYMANEVRYHTRLLAALDGLLIPTARRAELKSMLNSVRPAVAAHLEHAQRVQAGLAK